MLSTGKLAMIEKELQWAKLAIVKLGGLKSRHFLQQQQVQYVCVLWWQEIEVRCSSFFSRLTSINIWKFRWVPSDNVIIKLRLSVVLEIGILKMFLTIQKGYVSDSKVYIWWTSNSEGPDNFGKASETNSVWKNSRMLQTLSPACS